MYERWNFPPLSLSEVDVHPYNPLCEVDEGVASPNHHHSVMMESPLYDILLWGLRV
jgi:hypothetical protein